MNECKGEGEVKGEGEMPSTRDLMIDAAKTVNDFVLNGTLRFVEEMNPTSAKGIGELLLICGRNMISHHEGPKHGKPGHVCGPEYAIATLTFFAMCEVLKTNPMLDDPSLLRDQIRLAVRSEAHKFLSTIDRAMGELLQKVSS